MILVVDMNWKKNSLGFGEFVLPIVTIAKTLDIYRVEHYLEVANEDLSRCDSVILSGTALRDTATLRQPEKFQWLKETEKPVLGICAGMETIGAVFELRFNKCLEIGMKRITTVKENPLFSGYFNAYSLHSFCVEPSEDFEIWAKSSKCAQSIKHKTKPIYGVLFHPEVRNPELIKRFIRLDRNIVT
jgi:GMP synthase-like glutamine amidotransferase